MDMINNFLVNFNISQDMFFMLFILITTVLFVLTVGYIIIGVKSPVKRKLSEIASGGQAQTTSSRNEKVMNTLESLAPLTASGNEKDRQSNRMLLMNAGFHQKMRCRFFIRLNL